MEPVELFMDCGGLPHLGVAGEEVLAYAVRPEQPRIFVMDVLEQI
jgi:hypothetical protein